MRESGNERTRDYLIFKAGRRGGRECFLWWRGGEQGRHRQHSFCQSVSTNSRHSQSALDNIQAPLFDHMLRYIKNIPFYTRQTDRLFILRCTKRQGILSLSDQHEFLLFRQHSQSNINPKASTLRHWTVDTELSCLPKHSRYTFHIPISRTATQFSKVNHNWCSTVQSGMFCYTFTVERMRYRNQPSKKRQTFCATCSKQQMQGTMQIFEALLGCRSCLHCKHVIWHSHCWGSVTHITCGGQDILY